MSGICKRPRLPRERRQIELGQLRLADIAGNAHAIERSPQTVRSASKDSVFATLLLKGEAVFLHENGCLAATAGELIVYDTRRPYLFGFSSSMRQILVDVPRDLFAQACVGSGLPGPMLFGRGTAREGALVAVLSSRLGRLAALRGVPHDPADAEGTVLDLLRQLAEERTGGRPVPDAYHQELTGPRARETRITDVAHRWGFSSQAHFARLFRSRFGITPSEARAEATQQRTSTQE